MKALVSLTNKFGKSKKCPDICLLEVDSDTGDIVPILTKHPRLNDSLSGIASLVFYKGTIVFFTDGCLVGQLGQDRQVKKVWAIPVEQAHSAVYVNDKLYVAATQRDCVIESTPLQDKHLVYWRDNPGGKDTIHLNSIAHRQGEFYITAFGPRKDFWHSAESGYIKNITTGEIVVEGLRQPHTILNYADDLYFCNSATSEVRKIGSDESLLVDPTSYVRGMAFTKDMLAVATSKGRTKSRSTGKDLLTNFTDPGTPRGHCALHFYQRAPRLDDYRLVKSFVLDDYASEIFDVLPVDYFFEPVSRLSSLKNYFRGLWK